MYVFRVLDGVVWIKVYYNKKLNIVEHKWPKFFEWLPKHELCMHMRNTLPLMNNGNFLVKITAPICNNGAVIWFIGFSTFASIGVICVWNPNYRENILFQNQNSFLSITCHFINVYYVLHQKYTLVVTSFQTLQNVWASVAEVIDKRGCGWKRGII